MQSWKKIVIVWGAALILSAGLWLLMVQASPTSSTLDLQLHDTYIVLHAVPTVVGMATFLTAFWSITLPVRKKIGRRASAWVGLIIFSILFMLVLGPLYVLWLSTPTWVIQPPLSALPEDYIPAAPQPTFHSSYRIVLFSLAALMALSAYRLGKASD